MINSGETKTGLNVIAPSNMDTWTFQGNIGERVIITAVTTSGNLNSCITLYPPSGPAEVSTCGFCDPHIGWSGGGDRIDHQLQHSGTYTIMISDAGPGCGTDSGTYNISFLQIPGAVSSPEDTDGGPIVPGKTMHGKIDVASDMDVFQFWSIAGARVIITAVATSGNLNTCIRLYPPGGGPAEAATCGSCSPTGWSGGGDKLDYQLQQTGVYTIVIENAGPACLYESGDYSISLLKIPGSVTSLSDLDGGSIISGQSLSGTINDASDMDAFQFYGSTNDQVIINAVTTSGSLNTCVSLYPPEGSPAEATTCGACNPSGWSGGGDRLEHQIQQTGLYTIIIEDAGPACLFDRGTYGISFVKLPPDPGIGVYNPSPANGATVCGHCASFSWDAVAGATGYDVYFGELILNGIPIIAGNLQTPSLPFPEMEDGKVYYWVVIAHTPSGDIWSPVWWFKVSCDIVSDSSWKANTVEVSNWTAKGFDDSGWVYATVWPFGDIAGGVGAPVAPQQISGMEDTVANWIWSGALNYDTMVPEERYFRKTIYLCETPCSGSIRITADNEYHLYVNDGTEVGYGTDYRYAQTYVVTDRLTLGKNVIAVRAYDAYFNEGLLVDGKIMICGDMYTLTVNKAGTGSGAVTSLPTGINCGTDCSEAYNSGTLVTLTAAADSGSTFANWSTNCTVDTLDPKKCTVTIDATKTVTATFTSSSALPHIDLGSTTRVKGFTVTLPITLTNVSGTSISAIGMDIGYDTGILMNPTCTVGPAGSAAGKSCATSTPSSGIFRIGVAGLNNTVIGNGIVAYVTFTIKTTALPGSTPLTNTPSASDPDGNPVIVNGLNGSVTVTGTQSGQYTLSVSKSGTGSGTVTSSPAGINCGSDCSETYPRSIKPKKVTLKAKADSYSTFLGWGGDCQARGAKPTCTIKMDSDKHVTASFGLPDISVAPTSYDFGSVKVKQSSIPATFTVYNNGTGNLKITKMKIIGTDAKMFKRKGSTKKTIPPGSNYQFTVTFKPTSAGPKSSTLQINSNDPDTPTMAIQLSGTGESSMTAQCANIAGDWDFSESVTVKCTYDGNTETETMSGTGTITIEQNGCNVSWEVPDWDVNRTGTVKGNNIKVSGLFVIPLVEDVNLTKNTYTAEGTISGNQINLNGSGIAEGSFCYEGDCYNFKCTTIKDTVRLTRLSSTSMLKTMGEKETIRKPSEIFLNNFLKIFTTVSPQSGGN